jgi:hypothetical protein
VPYVLQHRPSGSLLCGRHNAIHAACHEPCSRLRLCYTSHATPARLYVALNVSTQRHIAIHYRHRRYIAIHKRHYTSYHKYMLRTRFAIRRYSLSHTLFHALLYAMLSTVLCVVMPYATSLCYARYALVNSQRAPVVLRAYGATLCGYVMRYAMHYA